jgi:hypothetical protein
MKKSAFAVILLLLVTGHPLHSQKLKLDLGNSHQTVNMLFFSQDSKYLTAGGFMKIWDTDSGTTIYSSSDNGMEFAIDLILSASISNDGRYIAMVKTGRLQVFDLTSRSICATVKGLKIAGVAFGPDNTLGYIQSDGKLGFINAASGSQISEQKLPNIKPLNIAWSPDGKTIALGGRDEYVSLYDVEKRMVTSALPIGDRWVTDIDFSPDSRYLAVSLKGGLVRLFEPAKQAESAFWQAHQGDATTITFHPSGKFLATGGADNFAKIWEIPSGSPAKAWEAHQKNITAINFSPDGRLLATGSFNIPIGGANDTRIWEIDGNYLIADGSIENRDSRPTPTETAIKTEPVTLKENLVSVTKAAQKRLALIIGNGIYMSGGILANPENDANDIGKTLQQLGFDVMLFNNLDQREFRKAIDDFGERLVSYDIGLFYYAGHGIQVKGNNYLIPVDANLKSENDVEYDCVNAGRLLAKMEDAGSTTNIIILDACRDNPFERSWRRSTHGQGLAFMTAPAGSLISYATSPGATASDGSGRNGLFTSALLNYINEPDLSILEMFQKVRTYVRENSSGEQVPWESTSLEGNFYFKE